MGVALRSNWKTLRNVERPLVERRKSPAKVWDVLRTREAMHMYCSRLAVQCQARPLKYKQRLVEGLMAECGTLVKARCHVDASVYNRVLRLALRWGVPLPPLLTAHPFAWDDVTYLRTLQHHAKAGEWHEVEQILRKVAQAAGSTLARGLPSRTWTAVLWGCAHGKHEAHALIYLRKCGEVGNAGRPPRAYALAMAACTTYKTAKKLFRMVAAVGHRLALVHFLPLLRLLAARRHDAHGEELQWVLTQARAAAMSTGGNVAAAPRFASALFEVHRAYGMVREAQQFFNDFARPAPAHFDAVMGIVAERGSWHDLFRMQKRAVGSGSATRATYLAFLRGCSRRVEYPGDCYYAHAKRAYEEAREALRKHDQGPLAFVMLDCAARVGDTAHAQELHARCDPKDLAAPQLLRGAFFNAGRAPPHDLDASVSEVTEADLCELRRQLALA
eukprot:TRINITY_DN18006_c0_g1_i1.p1 TRINITY_DN18006_c0_g1~~TRINITY_DN18006_c0_g1_i1.p1  ORF type:complete len:445 (+),score=132.41 TRINITY_DN18006_c0_g1_i1:51-1385(+)